MTWHLTLLLPAGLCGALGVVFANEAELDYRLGSPGLAVQNGFATVVCWAGAAVAFWWALA